MEKSELENIRFKRLSLAFLIILVLLSAFSITSHVKRKNDKKKKVLLENVALYSKPISVEDGR